MNNPIVISGIGGSGTRLIATMLQSCGFYIGSNLNSENDNLWFTLLFRRPLTFLPILKDQRESIEITQALTIFAKAMQGQPLDSEERSYVERAYTEISNATSDSRRGLPPDLRDKAKGGLLNPPSRDMTEYRGWGWKEPNSHLFLPYLSGYFPELRAIYVIRHPLDMAYSANQNQLYNWGSLFDVLPPIRPESAPQASLNFTLRASRAAIEFGTQHLRERFLILNFDQLCASPTEECARLLNFMGAEDIDVSKIVRLVESPQTQGRYRANGLAAFSQESLAEVRMFGFAVETVDKESMASKQSNSDSLLEDLFKKIDRHRTLVQSHETDRRQSPVPKSIVKKPFWILKRLRDFPSLLRRQTTLNKLTLQEIESLSLLLQAMNSSKSAGETKTAPSAPDRYAAYRSFVGPAEKYDLVAANQFNLLTHLGLREHHFLLDIGCGSLRGGRLFIPYLLPDHYFGIEPNQWLIREGIERELGADMVRIKRPTFDFNDSFRVSIFGRSFDYLLAQSIFSHAAPAQISVCFAEARRVMLLTSIFAASFRQGTANYEGSAWVYPGGVDYTLSFITDLAASAGLNCVPIDWSHPNGQKWIKLTLAQ